MKKPDRKAKTGNPGQKRPRGSAPGDRSRGWAHWLGQELNAFTNFPNWLGEFTLLIVVVAFGAILFVWRWLTA